MADRQFVKIVSWHTVRLFSDRVGRTWTVCGRRTLPGATIVDTLPAEKSCETCLRITTRQDDGR